MGLFYDVFTITPDFEEPPVYGVSNAVEMAALAPAQDTAFFPQSRPDMTFAFNFVFTTAAEIRALKLFFRDTAAGRLAPFYSPSWRADLPVGPTAAAANSAGDTKLSVFCAAYSATYLTTDPDHFGRQVFVWQPGENLFTAAVVAAEQLTQGHAVITVSQYLPFTIDPTTAIIGFCHLAHFDSDQMAIEYLLPAAAKVALKIRSGREYSDETVALSIVRSDHAPFLGFVSAAMVTASAVPLDTRVAAAAGSNAWVNTDGIRIAAGDPYDVALPDDTGALSPLSDGLGDGRPDHLSLSYDSDGGHVLAWQHSATEIRVGLHPDDPTYHTFTGLDPLLCTNLNVDGTVGDGDQDVAVYYRKPAEAKLYMRIGAGYDTELLAAILPVRPLKLKRVIEDTEARTLTVEFLDAQFRTVHITSAAYPDAPP